MNIDQLPVLQPITAQVLTHPEYNNLRLHSFGEWLSDNESALIEYFNALAPEGGPPDYLEWVVVQHEIQQMIANGATLSQLESLEAV